MELADNQKKKKEKKKEKKEKFDPEQKVEKYSNIQIKMFDASGDAEAVSRSSKAPHKSIY